MGDSCVDHDPAHPRQQLAISLNVLDIQKDLYKTFLQNILSFVHALGVPVAYGKE
jgi:hypothetical protein